MGVLEEASLSCMRELATGINDHEEVVGVARVGGKARGYLSNLLS